MGVFWKSTQGKFFVKKVVGCFGKIPKISLYFFYDDSVGGVGGAQASRSLIFEESSYVPLKKCLSVKLFLRSHGRLFWGKLIVKNEN